MDPICVALAKAAARSNVMGHIAQQSITMPDAKSCHKLPVDYESAKPGNKRLRTTTIGLLSAAGIFFCMSHLAKADPSTGNWHLDETRSVGTVTGKTEIDIAVTGSNDAYLVTVSYSHLAMTVHISPSEAAVKQSFALPSQSPDGFYYYDSTEKITNLETNAVKTYPARIGIRFLKNGNIRFSLNDSSFVVPAE